MQDRHIISHRLSAVMHRQVFSGCMAAHTTAVESQCLHHSCRCSLHGPEQTSGEARLAASGSGRSAAQARKAQVRAMPVASGKTCSAASCASPAACRASSTRKWQMRASSDDPAACTSCQ